jgi:hypothetical protein
VKCRQMEEKNMALQHQLEDLLGHNYVLVEKQTMTAIQESFSDFQKFIHKLRNVGYNLHISFFSCCLPLLSSLSPPISRCTLYRVLTDAPCCVDW